MTFSDGTPSTVSEMLAARRRSTHVCGRHCGTGYHPDAVTVQLIEQAEAAGIRRIRQDGPFRVREHHGFGHGLRPGEDRDMNCPSCTREDRNRTPCPDCGGGYWQEYIGPPPSDQYIVHDSICPVVAS